MAQHSVAIESLILLFSAAANRVSYRMARFMAVLSLHPHTGVMPRQLTGTVTCSAFACQLKWVGSNQVEKKCFGACTGRDWPGRQQKCHHPHQWILDSSVVLSCQLSFHLGTHRIACRASPDAEDYPDARSVWSCNARQQTQLVRDRSVQQQQQQQHTSVQPQTQHHVAATGKDSVCGAVLCGEVRCGAATVAWSLFVRVPQVPQALRLRSYAPMA